MVEALSAARVRELLSDTWDKVEPIAQHSFRQSERERGGVRSQVITPEDSLGYWVMVATLNVLKPDFDGALDTLTAERDRLKARVAILEDALDDLIEDAEQQGSPWSAKALEKARKAREGTGQ